MLTNYNTTALLTPLPPWRRALIRLSQHTTINPEKISKVIVMDPILCAKLLSCIESDALFHGKPNEVICHVLTKEKSILWEKLLAYNDNYYKVIAACAHFSLKKYWLEAVSVATAAYQLCKINKLNDTLCAQAYFAGVLHNIGHIVLTYLHLVTMNNILKESTSVQQLQLLEKEHFGLEHSEFGAEILRQQQVPESITTAIQYCEHAFDETAHTELTQVVIQAIEWQRSHSKKQTLLGKKLDAYNFRQLMQAEQRIINMSDIFAYESSTAPRG